MINLTKQTKHILFLSLLFLGLTITLQTSSAHAVPIISNPAPNQILPESPDQLIITFNEPVVPQLSRIRILSQGGNVIEAGAIYSLNKNNSQLAVDLPTSLKDGAYLVSWQVLSAVDGHTTTGSYSFGVGVAELTAVSSDITISAQLDPISALSRSVTVVGIALLLGFFAFYLLVWQPASAKKELPIFNHSEKLLKLGIALLLSGLILTFYNQTVQYNLFDPTNFASWIGTQFGNMWLLRLIATLILIPLLLWLKKNQTNQFGWWLTFILTGLLTLTVSFISHSAALAKDTLIATGIDFAHSIAATLWTGGLLYLLLTLRQIDRDNQQLRLNLIIYFSNIAAISVGTLILSGSYLATKHVGNWTSFVGTAYGQFLIIKLALTTPLFLIALINLIWIKPKLYTPSEKTTKRLTQLVTAETMITFLILLLVGFLTDLQRAEEAPLLADAPGTTVLVGDSDDLFAELTIEPALVGNNSFDIYLTDANGNPIDNASEIIVRYTFLDISIGSDQGIAEPIGDGHYRVEGSYISLIGAWQVELTARQPNKFDTFIPFRIEAGVGGNIRAQEKGGNLLERFAKFMTLGGKAISGSLMILFAIAWWIISSRVTSKIGYLIPLFIITTIPFLFGGLQLYDFFTIDFTPTKFLTNPILPDTESVVIGQQLYATNCVSCHGETGHGDGPLAETLPYLPADFTGGHTESHPDGDLYYWIRTGLPDTPMPSFDHIFSKEETWHLVNYVRRLSVQAVEPTAPIEPTE